MNSISYKEDTPAIGIVQTKIYKGASAIAIGYFQPKIA